MTRRSGLLLVAAISFALLIASSAAAAPPLMSRDDIICRAASGVGFSYYWGGGCWCSSGCGPNFSCSPGSCSGNCPGCSHSGSFGADCSGFVNKVWQVPDSISVSTCGHGPYVAASYTSSTSMWSTIARSSLQKGDALASSSHVLIYEQGDPWGQLVAYEARGCSYGIVHNWRSCSSAYVASRRGNLTGPCACSPGQTQTQPCGDCGQRTRSCTSSCTWGAWSGCQGQGPCSPGATQTKACCDCGSQARSCTNQCEWGSWSSCEGPDPGGVCETDQPGPCGTGTVRCVDGCSTCVSDYEPVPELCDTVDNDCNGTADEGMPGEMGETPPAYAAKLVDLSYPGQLEPGEVAPAWATFENVGSETWSRGEVWLASEPEPSALYDPDGWSSWQVAATLDDDVGPGESARFVWSLRAPDERVVINERFRLEDPTGELMRCPSPEVELEVRVGGWPEPQAAAAAAPDDDEAAGIEGHVSCTQSDGEDSWAWLLVAGGLLLVMRGRKE